MLGTMVGEHIFRGALLEQITADAIVAPAQIDPMAQTNPLVVHAPVIRMGCCDHVLTFLSVAAPTTVLVLAFSVMGIGDATYVSLSSWEWPWYAAAAFDAVLLLLMWTLDAPRWTRWYLVWFRRACVLLFVVVAGVACSLATRDYPFAPLQFATLSLPACCFVARILLLPRPSTSPYLASLGSMLFIAAVLLTMYFALWVFVLPASPRQMATGSNATWTNVWGGPVETYWRSRLKCEPYNASAFAENDVECFEAAFLWWFYPLIIALTLVLFSVACRFLARMTADANATERDALAVKAFLGVCAVAALGLYTAASVAGAGMGLSDLVSVGMIELLLVSIVLIGGSLGWSAFTKALAEQPIVRRAMQYVESLYEWCIALVLCVGALPILTYLLLSLLKQATRRLRGSSRAAAGGVLTGEATQRVNQLAQVHWGSVASKATILCLLYLTLAFLVAKAVVVLLSFVNMLLEGVALIW